MPKTPPAWLVQTMLKMGKSLPRPETPPFPENWDKMTGAERYEVLKKAYVSTEGRDFDTPGAEETYKRRAQRWIDMLAIKEPDQVPNLSLAEGYIVKFGGLTDKDVWYNSNKCVQAAEKFQEEFKQPYAINPPVYSGRAFDTLGLKIARWPGSTIPEQALRDDQCFQYIEGEFMPAEEYDHLIADPTAYLLTTFIPRICSNLKGLESFPSLAGPTTVASMSFFLMGFAMGPAKENFNTISKAANYVLQDMVPSMLGGMKITAKYGTPGTMGGMGIAPMDIVGDTLRGTRGVLMDIFRRPDELLAACDSVTPMALNMAVSMRSMGMPPFVFIPLHKGADSFMSTEQFARFYWPSYKKFLLGIIDAGLIPIGFAEGGYNNRLDFLADEYANEELPAGKTAWMFDQTDMKTAKDKIGKWAAIGGNVPTSMFSTASPQKMDEYCKKTIEDCAPGGGFFLAPGAIIMSAKDENFRMYIESTKKYGIY